MTNVLEFDGIEKSFDGRSVLSGIYMKCEVGKVIGLLGRNGSGKSTLMKVVFGSLPASFKSVRINKEPLLENYLAKKQIGYLPQNNWMPPHNTVDQVLDHFEIELELLVRSFPSFAEWQKFPVRNLSGGYQRILEVFLILYSRHEFVLLDEPFSGLMPQHVEDVMQEISKVKAHKGILISDHLYGHILKIADETYLLSNGKTYLIKGREELVFRGYLAE